MNSKENETKKCKYCQSEIDAKLKVCPVCNKKQKGHGCLIGIIVAAVIIIALCLVPDSGSDTSNNVTTNTTPEASPTEEAILVETEEPVDATPTEAAEDVSSEPVQEQEADSADSETPTEQEIEIFNYLNSLYRDGMEEEEADAIVAEKYNISLDELDAIFLKVLTYDMVESDAKAQNYTLEHGELVDVNINYIDNILVIKAKIKPSYSNKATILQNYLNVFDLVDSQGVTEYNELQYWAVADMTSGNESKVISFTVSHDVMEALSVGNIGADELGLYVDDLYILPSLLIDD